MAQPTSRQGRASVRNPNAILRMSFRSACLRSEDLAVLEHRGHDHSRIAGHGDGGAFEAKPSKRFQPHVRRPLSALTRIRMIDAAS
ncbi:MAG: hypothetical protein NXH82_10750 [Rhodobacteraceae bacterium]|nr:hypothetical protein [Paracoccaceae bacterium]